jgi:hypothetical protein
VLIRRYWPLALIVLVAAAISIVVHTQVFPAYSWNRDEPVYLWQMAGLREGQVFMTGGGHPLFFQPWLSGIRDGSYFSQYTLGWPIVLLVFDVLLGTAASALVLGTMLAVVGTYALARETTRDHSIALVAAAALTISPVLVIQSGVYLGYLFSLGLGTLFGACVLAGVRTRRWWLLVVGGVLVGYLLMTRPFDAFLWALAFGAYLVFAYRGDLRALLPAIGWGFVGFLPLLVATLSYNKHITGSFTEFPITAVDSRDTFGFGIRGFGTRWPSVDFGVDTAIRGVGRNGFELPPFLVGSYVGVVTALAGLWLRRRERTTYALLAVAVAFPVGYFFFWGISLSAGFAKVSGPIYLIPMFAPLCILIAATVVAAWRARRWYATALVTVLAVATVPFLVDRIDTNHSISEAQVPWQDAVREFQGRSLVFVQESGPYLLHLNPFSSNPPGLDGRILYATDRGAENLDLIADHPGRRVYYERTNLSTDDTLNNPDLPVPTVTVTPMEVERVGSLTVRVRVTSPNDDPTVVAYLNLGAFVDRRVLSTTASRGETFETEWHLAPPLATGAGDAVPLTGPRGTVVIGLQTAASPDASPRPRETQERFTYRMPSHHALADPAAADVLLPSLTYVVDRSPERLIVRPVSSRPSFRVEIVTAPIP